MSTSMPQRQDDDDWLDALAGRPRPGADPLVTLEATLLRAALRGWAPAVMPHAGEAADEVALLARAEAQGLLRARRWCAGCGARGRALAAWFALPQARAGLVGVAAALLVAIGLGVWRTGPDGDPTGAEVLRGSVHDGVWLLRAAHPQALRDRLVGELATVHVKASVYERLGRYGLDAELPQPLSPEVSALMQRHGMQAASDGSLRVEVEAATP